MLNMNIQANVMSLKTAERILVPIVLGFFSSYVLFSCTQNQDDDVISNNFVDLTSESTLYYAEEWSIKKPATNIDELTNKLPSSRVGRDKFANKELQIREKLLVVLFSHEKLTISEVNSHIGQHRPSIQICADKRQTSIQVAIKSISPSPYEIVITKDDDKSVARILDVINSLKVVQTFQWFMFMTGNSYLNDDMLDGKTMNLWWNEPHLIGKMSSNGIFLLKSGILFSASAMNSLLRHSFVCKFPYNAHNQGVELCINQTIASPNFKDLAKISDVLLIEKEVEFTVEASEFLALCKRSIQNQLLNVNKEIKQHIDILEKEKTERDAIMVVNKWPINTEKPANKYQVQTWDFFTNRFKFTNGRNSNVNELTRSEFTHLQRLIGIARKRIEKDAGDNTNAKFGGLISFYKTFDSSIGLIHILDLLYYAQDKERRTDLMQPTIQRAHILRPIHYTHTIEVPFVKENCDIILLIRIESIAQLQAAHSQIQKHCTNLSTRKLQAIFIFQRSKHETELSEKKFLAKVFSLKKVCKPLRSSKSIKIEHMILDRIKDVENQNQLLQFKIMDTMVRDSSTHSSVFVWISPHTDFQPEFLNRVCLNTIRNFQVYFPLPFVNYMLPQLYPDYSSINSTLANYREDRIHRFKHLLSKLESSKNNPQFTISRNYGFFDTNHAIIASMYGADYLMARTQMNVTGSSKNEVRSLLQLFSLQSSPTVHIFRPIEPTVKISADSEHIMMPCSSTECEINKLQLLGTRAQLAGLFLGT